jgi:hypothetical protein
MSQKIPVTTADITIAFAKKFVGVIPIRLPVKIKYDEKNNQSAIELISI